MGQHGLCSLCPFRRGVVIDDPSEWILSREEDEYPIDYQGGYIRTLHGSGFDFIPDDSVLIQNNVDINTHSEPFLWDIVSKTDTEINIRLEQHINYEIHSNRWLVVASPKSTPRRLVFDPNPFGV